MSIDKYKDMLDMPHHVSTKHKQLTAEERAAQFAPFAALVGYEEMVSQASIDKSKFLEISEGQYEKWEEME